MSHDFAIDYSQIPLLGRLSALQFTLRPAQMGFSNLVSGADGWQSLGSPFFRVGNEQPTSIHCRPEAVILTSPAAKLTVAFCGPDSVAVEVECNGPQTIRSGAPGRLHPVAGTCEQDWLAFDALRDGSRMELFGDSGILLSHGDFHAFVSIPGVAIAREGNGWSVSVGPGRTAAGIGFGYKDIQLARKRAEDARSRVQSLSMETVLNGIAQEWNEIFRRIPPPTNASAGLISSCRNAVWCLLTNTLSPMGLFRRPPLFAAKTQYPAIFPWDSAFAALALKEVDPKLAMDQIRLYADLAEPSGRVGITGVKSADGGVQFPLFTWAAWRIWQATGDRDFLKDVYPFLHQHARWWITDPQVSQSGIPLYRGSICLDDSPRFDCFAGEGRMSLAEPVYAPDLLSICCRDWQYLACMANVLGLKADAEEQLRQAERLRTALNGLYDPALKRYADRSVSGKTGTVESPFNHFPAALSDDRAVRSASAQALGPRGPFFGRFGVTTIATHEDCFDPYRGFRGAIWHAVNFLCAESCWQMGETGVAESIAQSSLQFICADTVLRKGFRENYHYLSGEGTGAHHFPTLSAAPFLSLALGHFREKTLI